ncbi:hypothetical protein [Haloarcula pelagica]|uniref:hypothetical protein n=1 Tax=Haloarcula pelagica TaxID=3033389 RepID=UPI0024C3A615|nr:hypothetical protein [Halomicroarcula sp. YJ-61-S]
MIDIDGVRTRDLNWLSVLLVGLAVGLALFAVRNVVGLLLGFPGVEIDTTGFATIAALICILAAYSQASPEFDGVCDSCGNSLTINTGAEGEDSMVLVRKTGSPRRASVGPLSFVVETRRIERDYCSPDCAKRDHVPISPDEPTRAGTPLRDVTAAAPTGDDD